MNHRSYRGRMVYLTDGVGEMGREWFHVTVQPDGSRTLRATCEMDDDRLLRDVLITIDEAWCPTDAFVRLTIEEQFVGSSWFRFSDDGAECQGFTNQEGRFQQYFETGTRTGFFGAHPLHGDAWSCATVERDDRLREPLPAFSSSHLPNGGSGPMLVPTSPDYAYRKFIDTETITVPAGTFETRHFHFFVGDHPPIDIWTSGADFVPVRLSWALLRQNYELVELEGDAQ